jgi:WXG100 family type VII secretion target
MASEIVQASYEELDRIAAQFGKASAAASQLRQQVRRSFEPLEKGGWQGRGADAFAKEMEAKVFPGLERMARALDAGRAATLEIKGVMERAEKEAAARFKSDGGAAALPGVVAPAPGAFDGKRLPFTVGKPQEVADYAFRSGKGTALKYDVTIDGKTISVYMPKNPGDPAAVHSLDEVTKGLAALPENSRKVITRVNVEPGANPDDAYWAKEYKDPNFSSYMTAGASGVVSIYPSNPKQSQDYLDGTLHHETGHTVSHQKWGSDTNDARWNDWKTAGKSDGTAASKYAQNSPSEDFAETYQLYFQVKGTPQEADARQRMPNRFQIIDDLVAGKR